MILDFGYVRPGTTLYVPFHTFDSNDPSASVTLTGLAVTDIEIYKNGSTTQRASDTGYALLDTDGIDFDSITGIHGFSINLASNATAGFFTAGAQYWVVVSSITVDAATINFVACTFRIGYPGAILNTNIATLASQTSFTLTTGSADNDAYNGCVAYIHDIASAIQVAVGYVTDYVGSTKTVTLAADPGIFTMAASDNISLFLPSNVQAVAGTTQTAGNIVSDTEAVLADTEAAVPVLTDTEAILSDTETGITERATLLTDTEAVLADTEASQTAETAILADTEAAITERATLLTDTEAILADTEGLAAGSGLTPLATGTAQSGTASTIVLAAVSAFADNVLNGNIIKIHTGTGAGQSRLITSNTLADDTCNVTPNWTTNPSSDSQYEIVEGAANVVAVGLTAQTAGDIIGDTEALLSDTEASQTSEASILADTEASQTAETAILADTEASQTAEAAILADTEAAGVPPTAAAIADQVWDELQSGHVTAGSFGEMATESAAILADTEASQTSEASILADTEASQTAETALLADTEASQTAEAAILADTEAAITERSTLLTDTEAVLADSEAISADTEAMRGTVIEGSAVTGTLSTTQMTTDLTGFADSELIGRIVVFTGGTADGQATDITAYASASGLVTFTAITTAPVNGDTFVIT